MQAFRLGRHPVVVLTLLCALLYLPGLAALPPLDRDEARFAQASKQMLESGDWLVPQFQDAPRSKKPAGIYWLQAGSVAAFAGAETGAPAIWAYRLPSVLGAWAAVLLTYAVGRTLAGRAAALLGAALLGGSLLLTAEAHQAKTDAVLLATVLLAVWGLARAWTAWRAGTAPAGSGAALAFWGGLGLSALIKGPVGPAVVLLALPALRLAGGGWGWARGLVARRGTWPGLALFAGLAGGWPLALALTGQGGFLWASASEDLIPKLLAAQESHGAPPGSHLFATYAGFWPLSLVLVPALARVWTRRDHPGLAFALAWAIPGWLLFEAVPTKLPHYVLPLYPALALIAAILLVEAPPPAVGRLGRWLGRVHLGVWTLLGLGLAGAMATLPQLYAEGGGLWAYGPAAVTAAGTLAVAWVAVTRAGTTAALAALALAAVVWPLLAQMYAPGLDRLWVARTVAAHLPPPAARPPLAAAGYHEPSLVFLAGTDTRLTTGAGVAQALAAQGEGGGYALVTDAEAEAFHAAADTLSLTPRTVASFPAFNYSKGDAITVTLYEVPGGQARGDQTRGEATR